MKRDITVKVAGSAPRFRRSLLASACVLAIGMSAAHASPATSPIGAYTLDFSAPDSAALALSNYAVWITQPQYNTAATNSATTTGISQTVSSSSSTTATPMTVSGNSIAAVAAGNQNTSSTDLGLIKNTGAIDGIGQLASQVQDAQVTTASATGVTVGISDLNSVSASKAVTGNSVQASTQLNQSNSTVAGVLPSGYTSGVTGTVSASLDSTSGISTGTAASVNVSTQQATQDAGWGAGSNALVAGSGASLNMTTTSGTNSSALALTENSVSAQYGGNQATNQFTAQAGSAPFTGTAAATNIQSNSDSVVGTGATAAANGASVSANFGSAGTQTLTGSLAVTGNQISATSTGNAAGSIGANGQIQAGNALQLASGADVTGTGTLWNGSGTISGTANGFASSNAGTSGGLQADLLIFNGQQNTNTAFDSEVNGGGVSVAGDLLGATGTVTLSGNSVQAASTGNLAGNLTSVNATNYSATSLSGSVQANRGTSTTAGVTGTSVASSIDSGSGGVNTQAGTTTLDGNSITATAQGNLAVNNTVVQSTNLTTRRPGSWAPSAQVIADATGNGALTTYSGTSVANLQGNYGGSPVSATVAGSSISAQTPNDALSAADISVTNNAIAAKAGANQASNGISLSGSTGNVQASAGNVQVNQSTVSATATDAGVLQSATYADGSQLSVSGNQIASVATANAASNGVAASFSDLTVGSGDSLASVTSDGNLAQANTPLGLANAQFNQGGVAASNGVTTGAITLDVRSLTGSTATANGNTQSAATTGNSAANTVSLTAATVHADPSSTVTHVAGLSNLQTDVEGSDSASVGQTIGSVGGNTTVGVQLHDFVDGSNVSANANTVSATALGNTASNQIAANVGNVANTTAAASGAITATVGGVTSAQNEFSLLNRQADASAGREATTSGNVAVGIFTDTGFETFDNRLTVTGNKVATEARNNNASNQIGVVGVTDFDSGASLVNQQVSSTSVHAQTSASTGVSWAFNGGTDFLDNSVAVTNNVTQAMAVGSSASSGISVQGSNLAGRANIAAGTGGSSYAGGVLATNADVAVANQQAQTGAVSANLISGTGIDTGETFIESGSLTVTGNQANAVAQATSASNAVTLSGGNIGGVSGAVSSVQTSSAPLVNAVGSVGFGSNYLFADGSPQTVSGNQVLVSAGQNEAFNQLSATGATIQGRGLGNAASAVDAATGMASVGADLSVLNMQSGAGPSQSTLSVGTVGASGEQTSGGNVAVSNNSAIAKAGVNIASNSLTIDAQSTVSATAAIVNGQLSSGPGATATLTSDGPVGTSGSLANTAVSVDNNVLNAQAGGNSASNALNVGAANSVAGSGSNPTFAVLNDQRNAGGTDNAGVFGFTVGLINAANSTGVTGAVQGNQVVASAYGNSASNSLALSALTGTANLASAGISSLQYNSNAISSMVAGVSVGVTPGASMSGGSAVVSGNSIVARSVGNSATNVLSVR